MKIPEPPSLPAARVLLDCKCPTTVFALEEAITGLSGRHTVSTYTNVHGEACLLVTDAAHGYTIKVQLATYKDALAQYTEDLDALEYCIAERRRTLKARYTALEEP